MKFDSPANVLIKAAGKPPFIYGTAWKRDETRRLVSEALKSGFVAIDTAAQPRHYREDLVGAAIRDALTAGTITRDQIYIQTKYTSPGGQDLNNMPYDVNAPLQTQIHTSVASSLANFKASDQTADQTYLDCLVMHSPMPTLNETLAAWSTLETYVPEKIRHLGISNTTLPVLQAIWDQAKVKPSVVQNRFYRRTAYDVPLRRFCREKGIAYQSFWTLTGNPELLQSDPVRILSKEASVENEVALYCLVMGLDGVTPLNGTTNSDRMKSDLQGIERVRNWTFVYGSKWDSIMSEFKKTVGDE